MTDHPESHHQKWLMRQVELQNKPLKSSCYKPLDQSILEKANSLGLETYLELNHLLEWPTLEGIQSLYQSGRTTAYDLVRYTIMRIGIYNQKLNAVSQLSPTVIEEAKALGPWEPNKPLWGVPVLLKDNIATGPDMPNTAGAHALLHATTKRPAHLVSLLKEAGALIIGKANLSEWANFMTLDSSNGFSALGGQTRNPYGPYDVGGSSAGSCVAVAAGFTAIAVGTETAGSLVYPASQNNVVTIKPTVGLISRDLIVPISDTQDTAGPIASSVKDAAQLLQVLSGPCQWDAKTISAPESQDYLAACHKSPDGLKIGILSNPKILADYRQGDDEVINEVIQILQRQNMIVTPVFVDDKACETNMYEVLLYEFYRDVNGYLAHPDTNTVLALEDIIAYNQKDLVNRAPYGQALLEKSTTERAKEKAYKDLVTDNVLRASAAIYAALQEVDVIMTISNYGTILYATAGYPAVTVPAGFRPSGEPVGITFFGGAYQEALLLTVAQAFESAKANESATTRSCHPTLSI